MPYYNYEYRAKYTNAIIVISVEAESKEEADLIAEGEFDNAMSIDKQSWYVGESWEDN
jgi:hypothetical protein